jgi:hypothetical protein
MSTAEETLIICNQWFIYAAILLFLLSIARVRSGQSEAVVSEISSQPK